MIKTFEGEVITSEDGSFVGSDGATISGQRVAIAINEEKSMTFFVSGRDEAFESAKACQEGDIIRVSAKAKETNDGKIKWRALQIEFRPSE